jgi:hypothetical protein
MTSSVHESSTPGYAHGFPDPIGALRAARLTAVTHPDWCDRTRCEVRVGAVRHIGQPVHWHALGDDVEFSLSRMQRDDDPVGYLFKIRHVAVFDPYEIELVDGDIDAFPVARMRLHLAEQEIEGDPRDDVTATAELPVVEAQVTASADHG